jgi:hypothetical protein
MKKHITLLLSFLLFGTVSICAGMDDARLKDRLVNYYFCADQGSPWEEFDGFKERFAVTDEQLHRVLMDIYSEAEGKLSALTPKTDEWTYNRGIAEGAIRWLPKCGDIPVKDFLLDYVASKGNDSSGKKQALLSYLRVADAEEAKDVLLRFLVGEERMDDYARSSIYVFAKTVWDTAPPEKKAAIFTALRVAAAAESPQWVFEECDSRLIAMDAHYKDSSQRESMLERQLSLPFSKYYAELKDQMGKEVKRLEKVKRLENISTNLALLKSPDPYSPRPDSKADDASDPALEDVDAKPGTTAAVPPPRSRFAAPLAAGAGLLAALLLWRGLRKRM